MITKQMVADGRKQGLIKLVDHDEPMCEINGQRFYCAGSEFEGETVETYLECVPEDDIDDEIFESLESMRVAEFEEYDAIEAYLDTNLK